MMPMSASMARFHHASRQAISVWRALGVSMFMVAGVAMTASAQIVSPPDTARIVNSAAYRFTATDGTVVSDSVSMSVLLRHLAGLTLTPPRAQAAPAGVRRTFAHTLRNTGTAADAYSIAASAPAGWSVT